MKLDKTTMALGAIACVVSAWGMFTLMTNVGHAPFFIALLPVFIIEVFAVGLGRHAIRVALDGDNSIPYIAATVLVAIVAAGVQFAAAITVHHSALLGIVMAMAPIAAITLWTAELTRNMRVAGRAEGLVAPPVPVLGWKVQVTFPKAARQAKRYLMVDPELSIGDAMIKALALTNELSINPPNKFTPPVRRNKINVSIDSLIKQPEAITPTAEPTANQVTGNGHSRSTTVPPRITR